MTNVVVIGSQWGDEGKGKIVDWMSQKADVIVRFQGGHNAGHTLVINNTEYKLSLLPSGVVRKNKMSVIGNGVVIDPNALINEIQKLKKQGVNVTPKNLKIAENTALILSMHQELDAIREDAAKKGTKIGTTRRGIGPAYEDKVGRRAIRLCDLQDAKNLPDKIERLLVHHNAILRGLKKKQIKNKDVQAELKKVARKILSFKANTTKIINDAIKAKKQILFEGAQGTMLDVDHGTYPFVTSSNTIAAQAATGTGIGPNEIGFVLGITKAYTTRVGEGPFPTELNNKIGQELGERGNEFGTVTGRKRRCGWFDATLVKHAVKVNGINGIALTKLDVLDTFDEIKICTKYKINGKITEFMPIDQNSQKNAKPVYKTIKGWNQNTKGINKFNQLPKNAVRYIRYIEKIIGAKITMISTSPERNHTILVKNPFDV